MDTTKDIYIVVDELIATLEHEKKIIPVSYEFNQIKSNALKVKFVLRVLSKYDRIPKIELRKSKDNAHAKTLRQNGNKLFALKGVSLFKALDFYNQSICFAEDNTDELSICYANRSAVYFECHLYEVCLENIELARMSGYPGRLMDKIKKRERECYALLADPEKSSDRATEKELLFQLKLSLPAHPDVPFIVEALELKHSHQFGRYVVTKTDVSPGEVLALEEPYINIILPHLRYQRCTHCMTENQLSLVPCKGCTSAMFCSLDCYEKAQSTYHRFECPIIDYLNGLFNKLHLIALRATIKAITSFGSIERLRTFIEECGDSPVNAFTAASMRDLNYESTDQRIFHQIYSLETNQDKRSKSDLFQRAVIAAVLYHQLMRNTPMADLCKHEDDQNTVLDLLFRFLQTSPTNFHSLTLVEAGDNDDYTYGSAAYPFCSLINHSCAPNILRVSFGQKMAVIALRCIKSGEQLLDNYG